MSELNVILCGLPASGKSFFARLVAEKRGCSHIDTDDLVEDLYCKQYGKNLSCREIYSLAGEEAFRSLERKAVLSLNGQKGAVIAVGGGTLLVQDNIATLKTLGPLLFLQVTKDIIEKRLLQGSSLPAYLDASRPQNALEEMVQQRLSLYLTHCDHVLEIGRMTHDEVVSKICSFYG